MVEPRWITMWLFLILVLQFTAPTEQHFPSFIVRIGDDITLPCENVRGDQNKCDRTIWLFSDSPQARAQVLVRNGQIDRFQISKSKSDRLNITETCSLVITEVKVEDVGHYGCRQFEQQDQDAQVDLSAVKMTEQESADKVTLSCSVLTRGECRHTAKWLFSGKDIDENNNDLRTSQSPCLASVSFATSHFIYASEKNTLLKCEVSYDGKEERFSFSPPSTAGENEKGRGRNKTTTNPKDWRWFVTVAVGLTALLITAVALVRWKRNKGRNTQTDENMAEPGDDVSYASISDTMTTPSEGQIQGCNHTVTYYMARAPASFAEDADDPDNIYATIN